MRSPSYAMETVTGECQPGTVRDVDEVDALALLEGVPAVLAVVVVAEGRGERGAQAEPGQRGGHVGDAAGAGAHAAGPGLGAAHGGAVEAGEDDVEEDRAGQVDVAGRVLRGAQRQQRVDSWSVSAHRALPGRAADLDSVRSGQSARFGVGGGASPPMRARPTCHPDLHKHALLPGFRAHKRISDPDHGGATFGRPGALDTNCPASTFGDVVRREPHFPVSRRTSSYLRVSRCTSPYFRITPACFALPFSGAPRAASPSPLPAQACLQERPCPRAPRRVAPGRRLHRRLPRRLSAPHHRRPPQRPSRADSAPRRAWSAAPCC